MSNLPSPGDRFVQVNGDMFRRVHNPAAAYDSIDGLSAAAYGRRMAKRLTTGPAMAFDLTLPDQDENVRQAELDEGDAEVESSISSVAEWCKSNLSSKDITELVNRLLDNNGAQDEPPAFHGQPRTGGKAMDSAARRRAPMSAAERLSLDTLCPGLARIKCI
jgi:hypothetical protein